MVRRTKQPAEKTDAGTNGAAPPSFPVPGTPEWEAFSPEEQLAFYDGRTRSARESGYTGLRVVAEVTALASDTRHSAGFLRWEHLADDFVASGSGFSALCAYSCEHAPPLRPTRTSCGNSQPERPTLTKRTKDQDKWNAETDHR